MKGPDSFRKCSTIGSIEISFEEFSKNFAFCDVLGFFEALIAFTIVWWIVDDFAPIACANLALVPTRLDTTGNFRPITFWKNNALEFSNCSVIVAISNFVETLFVIVFRSLVFLIGGAFGFDEKMYNRAQEKISFSRMTFSHQMIRLLFLEQVYRANSILKGEKYHHTC